MVFGWDTVMILFTYFCLSFFYWKGEQKRARKAIWDCWLEWFCPDLNGVTQIASSANCILPVATQSMFIPSLSQSSSSFFGFISLTDRISCQLTQRWIVLLTIVNRVWHSKQGCRDPSWLPIEYWHLSLSVSKQQQYQTKQTNDFN